MELQLVVRSCSVRVCSSVRSFFVFFFASFCIVFCFPLFRAYVRIFFLFLLLVYFFVRSVLFVSIQRRSSIVGDLYIQSFFFRLFVCLFVGCFFRFRLFFIFHFATPSSSPSKVLFLLFFVYVLFFPQGPKRRLNLLHAILDSHAFVALRELCIGVVVFFNPC